MIAPLTPYLAQLARGETLSADDMRAAMATLLKGEASEVETAGFLMGLRARGETIEEIAAAAEAMRALALRVDAPADAIDTCGTGGDGANTVNVSTAAALIAAGCGLPVAKHGNRAASSLSGSSDILSVLGVKLDVSAETISRCIRKANVGFMFAALHHSAVANVAPVRKRLGVRTMFNVLGPLCNPAGARRQVMGVFAKNLCEPIAHVLARLGAERAWVVHGADGLDELTTTGVSYVAALEDGAVRLFDVTPEDAGLQRDAPAALKGGAPEENAAALRRLLDGEKSAYRNIAVLNAAAALVVAQKAADLKDGAAQAAAAIDNGAAAKALADLVRLTNEAH
ncbi:MAG: anthranilate phosphoribosyltransferase [Pseudomonadota bacterium]